MSPHQACPVAGSGSRQHESVTVARRPQQRLPLLADRAYDTDAIRAFADEQEPVPPPR